MKIVKKRHIVVVSALLLASRRLNAHDPNATITWNREISRIFYERCVSCHRDGGTSFSLMTYQEVQPRAAAIKDSVLSRRMPPWGAVKGFGDFRNDNGLSQEQIALITDWIEGGTLRGNNPNALPAPPKFDNRPPFRLPANAIAVTEEMTIARSVTLDGIYPDHVAGGESMQITATRPDGSIEALLWLYEYKNAYQHPFLFRKPINLPAGSVIRGVRPGTTIFLIVANG